MFSNKRVPGILGMLFCTNSIVHFST